MRRTVLILVLFALVLTSGCTGLFFYPEKRHYDNPAAKLFSPENIYFKTDDGLTLHGWLLRTPGEAVGTVLVMHGNAQNVSTHVNGVLWLVREGFNVFLFDYRGYGWSEGRPTIQGIHQDAEAALETLVMMPGINHDRIIVLGQSLGGAVAVYTAVNSPERKHIKALVIDSAFSGYRLIAREKLSQLIVTWPVQYPLSYLFNDAYSPVKWIAKVSPVPVIIIHGEQDAVVPAHHAEALFDAAREPKQLWRVPRLGHIQSFANVVVRKDLVRNLEHYLAEK